MNPIPQKKLGLLSRKSVSLSPSDLVLMGNLDEGFPLPMLARPGVEGVSLRGWFANNRNQVAKLLASSGAILFRGFAIETAVEFEKIAEVGANGTLMNYSFRSTPRKEVEGKIYTSTEYPADQSIPMHNEMSYTSTWPLKIWFFCSRPALEGGETPIADSRRIYHRIDPGIRMQFEGKGVLYIRNYGDGLDLAWEDVFQTTDRSAVDRFCQEAGIEAEWKPGNRLRTQQRCQGIARHPATGESVWFNQAHLFHRSSLDPILLEKLIEAFGKDGLPRDAHYGDGRPIEASVLEEIRAAYDEESVAFPWEPGDLLMVDNMLVAHGRRPFRGERKILVAMAEPHREAR